MRFTKSLGLGLATFGWIASTSAMPAFAATNKSLTASSPYVVQQNDTFWIISRRFNIRLQSLLAANPNTNPLNLYPGLLIRLPMVPSPSSAPSARASDTVHARESRAMTGGQVISCVATAYSDSPAENGWGSVDYLGNPLALGTIAVDPSVIPLGSRVYITGYTFRGLPQSGMWVRATDEGSAIQGNRIDIFIPGGHDVALQFGIQNVQVHLSK